MMNFQYQQSVPMVNFSQMTAPIAQVNQAVPIMNYGVVPGMDGVNISQEAQGLQSANSGPAAGSGGAITASQIAQQASSGINSNSLMMMFLTMMMSMMKNGGASAAATQSAASGGTGSAASGGNSNTGVTGSSSGSFTGGAREVYDEMKQFKYQSYAGDEKSISQTVKDGRGNCMDLTDVASQKFMEKGYKIRRVRGIVGGGTPHHWLEYFDNGKWKVFDSSHLASGGDPTQIKGGLNQLSWKKEGYIGN